MTDVERLGKRLHPESVEEEVHSREVKRLKPAEEANQAIVIRSADNEINDTVGDANDSSKETDVARGTEVENGAVLKILESEGSSKKASSNVNSSKNSGENASVRSDAPSSTAQSMSCPYLGTVNRQVLDFDFEKVCSVSLSNQRPYACLVCGKFFQGRSKGTFAFTHALDEKHFLFINLHDQRIYCLPDNYEVIDRSLDDIKYHLNPTFTEEQIKKLSTVPVYGKALDGTDFIPGCVGLNNLKHASGFNAVIQGLCRVVPLRNMMLSLDLSKKQSPDPVLRTFSELMRKIWNAKNFKGIVSPHAFLQAISTASQKHFAIGKVNDPLEFLTWLLHRLHMRLKHRKQQNNSAAAPAKDSEPHSPIHEWFQGEIRIVKTTISNIQAAIEDGETESQVRKFLYLPLDVPSPLMRDAVERCNIPQIPIFDVLKKFDGLTTKETGSLSYERYSLWKLPPYLIVHMNRFTKNQFYLEKNETIVTFPIRNLELRNYVHPDALEQNPVTRYNLVANITHEGKPDGGMYIGHVFHSATGEWYEINALRVTPQLPQIIALSQAYIQIYERADVSPLVQESDVTSAFVPDDDMFAGE